ncbi:hypothetical protein PBAL39_25010 [Pedobacter sp. BAL39]|uniref:DUF3857 domain-containing protein n=1 Tax=Pedobacter sp. BAL39 TaxID=391596 RepID=UPI000155A020|nr:transglutaminase domain-containing protein [Pedobacter sp. BAL39]EDM36588.1 hypothetical protein PBAL39_25010 [Pedobacter sp. BAL39]
MNKPKVLVLCLLFIATLSSYAQKKESIVKMFKYGKIEPSEFETKVSGTDSAAAAVALFDVGTGWFEISPKTQDFVYVFERHTRYKVINKTGYDVANLEIQLYRQSGGESTLEYMDGAAYNMENGKMVVSKINKDAKFSEKQDKNYTLKKFTLPNVKEGTIVEFKYKMKSDFTFTLRPWYFQKEIPVLYSQYSVKIPEYLTYKSTPGGFIYLNPTQEMVNDNFYYNGQRFDFSAKKIQYIAENVPGLKDEMFVTTMDDYVSKIEFELNATKYPGQAYKTFTSTWPEIVGLLQEDENFGTFTNKHGFNKTLLQTIVKNEKNPDSILNLVFKYVKNNIKWNGQESKYTSTTTPKNIFDKKSGNSADINLTVYALLREAGITVNPVLISTRSNGQHPGFPMITKFDNVILQAKMGEKTVLLDATDKNHTPGLISYSNLNHAGFKIDLDAKNGGWISLDDEVLSRKAITYNLLLDEEHKLSGKLFISSSNYEGLRRRNSYQAEATEAEFLKTYKSDKPGLSIKNYSVLNMDNPGEPLVESMDVDIEENIEEAGDLTYFTPLLFERTKENPFKLDERQFPVDFAYPFEETYRISVEYPKGYQIDKMPKSERMILPDNIASFTFIFAAEDGRMVLSSKITVPKAVYSAEEYHGLKELFMNIVRKQSEQIVLKKI